VEPAEFERYREAGLAMGFAYVASGPLVRSSYRAAEAFLHGMVEGDGAAAHDRYGRRAAEPLAEGGEGKKHLTVVT
jgi:lipoyl synthase